MLGSDFSGQRIKGRKRDILIGRISSFLLNRKTEHSALDFLSHKNAPRGRKMSGDICFAPTGVESSVSANFFEKTASLQNWIKKV